MPNVVDCVAGIVYVSLTEINKRLANEWLLKTDIAWA